MSCCLWQRGPYFVSRIVPEDAKLHAGLTDFGVASMIAIDLAQLSLIVHASGTPEFHPVYELLLDAAIEDAAQGVWRQLLFPAGDN